MTTTAEFQRPSIPLAFRVLNATGRGLEMLGLRPFRLDEESLCAAACRKTGLTDFGDERFRVGLRSQLQMLESFRRYAFLGRMVGQLWFGNALYNRLLIEEHLKRHPEILQLPVPRPLVICGLGRSGTTLLQHLLSLDRASRPLLAWEARSPAPPLSESAQAKRDSRIRQAARLARFLTRMAPQFLSITIFDVEGPTECGALFRNAFLLPSFGKDLQTWREELTPERLEWAYQQYRRQLQLLQWQRPATGHWLLKWPMHLIALDTLVNTLPGTGVVMPHRDPCRVVASACQMVATLGIFFGEDRWKTLPREMMWLMVDVLQRAEEARRCMPPGSMLDVSYRQLMADPAGTVRQIYEHFDYPYSGEFEGRVRTWLAEHPKRERSKSYHSLEQFGLDRPTVEKAFESYMDRYHVDREK